MGKNRKKKQSQDVKQASSSHLESLGEHFSDFLLSEGTCTLENFGVTLGLFFLFTAASTRADGAAKPTGRATINPARQPSTAAGCSASTGVCEAFEVNRDNVSEGV